MRIPEALIVRVESHSFKEIEVRTLVSCRLPRDSSHRFPPLTGVEEGFEKKREMYLSEQSWVTELGTAIGVHGGPGTLVVSLQELREPGS